jgi:hypothetical protein
MPEAAPAGKAGRKKTMIKIQRTADAFSNPGTGITPFTFFGDYRGRAGINLR